MKFNYWLELPMALITLLEGNLTLDEIELGKHFLNTSKAMETLTIKLEKEIDRISISYITSKKELINSTLLRLKTLEKEKSLIMIQAIKFSVKLSSKFMNHIERNTDFVLLQNDYIMLTKIKFFLNILKSILTNINDHLKDEVKQENLQIQNADQEIQFCYVLKIFYEKIESKIFSLSIKHIWPSISKQENIVLENSEQNGELCSFHQLLNEEESKLPNKLSPFKSSPPEISLLCLGD